jgi:hypothetical protein
MESCYTAGMPFDASDYGLAVSEILALDGDGNRLMPLAMGVCSNREAARLLSGSGPGELLPNASEADSAYSGLWLYFSCLEESHRISQEIHSASGSFWHGIMHRQEPDAGNSAYWFRRVGRHPIFDSLQEESARLAGRYPEASFRPGDEWDPFAFIEFCEDARSRPGSSDEQLALRIQRAEWQLLFDYCARP